LDQGPWAVTVDGNDNVRVSNLAMSNSPITQLCGVRADNSPPGLKTCGQISLPGGYVGGEMQTTSPSDRREMSGR
jgi:hypothetical protein